MQDDLKIEIHDILTRYYTSENSLLWWGKTFGKVVHKPMNKAHMNMMIGLK